MSEGQASSTSTSETSVAPLRRQKYKSLTKVYQQGENNHNSNALFYLFSSTRDPIHFKEAVEDKSVLVHETVSRNSKEVLLKENQNLSLLLPPARKFSRKPKNVDFGIGLCERQVLIKRQGQEKCLLKS